ncbi:MAG TPA: threonine/serine dehydratase [Terriglobales bacterium]|nr:threonine/serine dehydratase [Terriglobales bacterium]
MQRCLFLQHSRAASLLDMVSTGILETSDIVTLPDIQQARERIRGVATRTPLYHFPSCDGLHLKLESLQPIGSFKLRGAYNKIASLSDAERARGVITYSSGNHAQGVSYAAQALGVKATVVMPRTAPKVKIARTESLGAEIVLVGPGSLERQRRAEQLAAERGLCVVPPFNDERIIAGQGTIGLEILEDLADVELVLAPIGGGGLVSGISAAIKLSGSKAKVVGVEPALAADAQASFRAGRLVELPAEQTTRTLADGLRTQSVGPIPFQHIRKFVDDVVTVSEDEIREAMRRLAWTGHVVAEPSGAVTAAAYWFHQSELPRARRTAAVVSGGNVEPDLLRQVLG